MNQQQAYLLQERIRKETPGLLRAVYCLRSIKGPIGKKPWQVDASYCSDLEPVRFRSEEEYDLWKDTIITCPKTR